MFVYLFLPFASLLVPASAYETTLRRAQREISNIHPFRTPHNDKYLGHPYGGAIPSWSSPPGNSLRITGARNFEKKRKQPSASSLEIAKSIELKFDPKNRVLTPVNEETEKREMASKSSLALLAPFTQKQLAKLFEKYDKEAKGGGIADVKNYQTGRFKLYYLKRSRLRV